MKTEQEIDVAIRKTLSWNKESQEIPFIEQIILPKLRAVYLAGMAARIPPREPTQTMLDAIEYLPQVHTVNDVLALYQMRTGAMLEVLNGGEQPTLAVAIWQAMFDAAPAECAHCDNTGCPECDTDWAKHQTRYTPQSISKSVGGLRIDVHVSENANDADAAVLREIVDVCAKHAQEQH